MANTASVDGAIGGITLITSLDLNVNTVARHLRAVGESVEGVDGSAIACALETVHRQACTRLVVATIHVAANEHIAVVLHRRARSNNACST